MTSQWPHSHTFITPRRCQKSRRLLAVHKHPRQCTMLRSHTFILPLTPNLSRVWQRGKIERKTDTVLSVPSKLCFHRHTMAIADRHAQASFLIYAWGLSNWDFQINRTKAHQKALLTAHSLDCEHILTFLILRKKLTGLSVCGGFVELRGERQAAPPGYNSRQRDEQMKWMNRADFSLRAFVTDSGL